MVLFSICFASTSQCHRYRRRLPSPFPFLLPHGQHGEGAGEEKNYKHTCRPALLLAYPLPSPCAQLCPLPRKLHYFTSPLPQSRPPGAISTQTSPFLATCCHVVFLLVAPQILDQSIQFLLTFCIHCT